MIATKYAPCVVLPELPDPDASQRKLPSIRQRVRAERGTAPTHTTLPVESYLARSTYFADLWRARTKHHDRSTRDFALLGVLIREFDVIDPARLMDWLYALPGGKAATRGTDYAYRTVERALERFASRADQEFLNAEAEANASSSAPPPPPPAEAGISPEDRARQQALEDARDELAAQRAAKDAQRREDYGIDTCHPRRKERTAALRAIIDHGYVELERRGFGRGALEGMSPESLRKLKLYCNVRALEVTLAHHAFAKGLKCLPADETYLRAAIPAKRGACLHYMYHRWEKVRRWIAANWPSDENCAYFAWLFPLEFDRRTRRNARRVCLRRLPAGATWIDCRAITGNLLLASMPRSAAWTPPPGAIILDSRWDAALYLADHHLSTSAHLDRRIAATDLDLVNDPWLSPGRTISDAGGLPYPSDEDLRAFFSGNSTACPACKGNHGAAGVMHCVMVNAGPAEDGDQLTPWRPGYGSPAASAEGATAAAAERSSPEHKFYFHRVAAWRRETFGARYDYQVSGCASAQTSRAPP